MIRDSLRLRLLAGAAVAIFVALARARAAMGWFFENHIEQREAAALIRHGKLIANNLRVNAAGKPSRARRRPLSGGGERPLLAAKQH